MIDSHVSTVYVPPGAFRMGSTEADIETAYLSAVSTNPHARRSWFTPELPPHPVRIERPFWLDLTPVTNAAYAHFVAAGGYHTPDYWTAAGWAWRTATTRPLPTDHSVAMQPEQPRVGVTWFEASAYCRWRGGRLPTEAEWEWAARGSASLAYPWGETFIAAHVIGYENCVDGPAPVGELVRLAGASWVGALDMSGNVWEWCNTSFDQALYPYPYRADDGRENAEANTVHVLRGGSWLNDPAQLRAAYRTWYGSESHTVGFRCLIPA